MQNVKLQDMKFLHILVVLLCYIRDRMFNFLLSTNCFDEFFLHLFLMSLYTSDIMLNCLKSTNCYDELFFCEYNLENIERSEQYN